VSKSQDIEKRPRQKLLPLFLLGLGLTVFGFYFALVGGGDVTEVASREVKIPSSTTLLPEDLERQGAATLENRPQSISQDVIFTQTQVGSVDGEVQEIEIRISARLEDERIDEQTYRRRYRNVGITVTSNKTPMSVEIAQQVAALIETVEHEIELEEQGKMRRFELVSNPSGELAQFLSVIEGASVYLTPHFPREAVNVDEPWTYASILNSRTSSGREVQGEVQFVTAFRGWSQKHGSRVAIVEQNLSGRSEGLNYSGHGIGRALFHVNVEGRYIERATLHYEQVGMITSGGAPQSLQSTITLESVAVTL